MLIISYFLAFCSLETYEPLSLHNIVPYEHSLDTVDEEKVAEHCKRPSDQQRDFIVEKLDVEPVELVILIIRTANGYDE